jgi:hypothetical protein
MARNEPAVAAAIRMEEETSSSTEGEIVLTREKSEEFAFHFELLKIGINQVDWDYAKACVKKLREQVSFQQNASILAPDYPLAKTDVIALQADALSHLCKAVDLLKQADDMKGEVAAEVAMREKIKSLFL